MISIRLLELISLNEYFCKITDKNVRRLKQLHGYDRYIFTFVSILQWVLYTHFPPHVLCYFPKFIRARLGIKIPNIASNIGYHGYLFMAIGQQIIPKLELRSRELNVSYIFNFLEDGGQGLPTDPKCVPGIVKRTKRFESSWIFER